MGSPGAPITLPFLHPCSPFTTGETVYISFLHNEFHLEKTLSDPLGRSVRHPFTAELIHQIVVAEFGIQFFQCRTHPEVLVHLAR